MPDCRGDRTFSSGSAALPAAETHEGEPPDAQGAVLADSVSLRGRVREVMDSHWVDGHSYTAPNPIRYPHQWLWDSCFHSLVWLELDRPDRALAELRSALLPIDDSGHVPHMRYPADPRRSLELWGRRGSSSITQPPLYGHALAVLCRAGVPGADELIEPARRGLLFLLQQRRRDRSGLLLAAHPWETGCDDSPRFDDYCPGSGFDPKRWMARKLGLLSSVERGRQGEPLANPAFRAAPASLSALTAFSGIELAALVGDDELGDAAVELAAAVDARWDSEQATWADAGAAETGSGRIRTADGLLGLLVTEDQQRRATAESLLVDPAAYGAACGPRGVHPDEAAYDPEAYWRGSVWPQLAYLLSLGLSASGTARLAETTAAGTAASGLAEYWNPDTGSAGGAVPQSWAGLALLMEPLGETSPQTARDRPA